MEWVETTARTVEEAKELALDQLGVVADDAEFEVLAEPKQGLFGRVRGRGPRAGTSTPDAGAPEAGAPSRPEAGGRRRHRCAGRDRRGGRHRPTTPRTTSDAERTTLIRRPAVTRWSLERRRRGRQR